MPPSDRRVAELRLRAEKYYLTATCDIEEATTWTGITKDATSYTTVHSDVPCRVILQRQFARNEVIDLAGLEIIGELYVLALPQSIDINANTRVLTGGVYYDIVNAKQRLTDKVFNLYVITRQEGI